MRERKEGERRENEEERRRRRGDVGGADPFLFWNRRFELLVDQTDSRSDSLWRL